MGYNCVVSTEIYKGEEMNNFKDVYEITEALLKDGKTEQPRATHRVGTKRLIEFADIGASAILPYADNWSKVCVTSMVLNIEHNKDEVILTTMNTIYKLKKVGENNIEVKEKK